MRLDLVHRGCHFRERAHVDESFGIEVRDADGAELAGVVCVFHRAVRAGVVAHGLVEQHEVDVVGSKRA